MNPVLEKLLILQDRDSRLLRLNTEMDRVPVEKEELDQQEQAAVRALEDARMDSKRIEADRKRLENEAESRRTQMRKYQTQLLDIKNNEQFHALQHEIAAAEGEIRKIEDTELELMEQYERGQAQVKKAEVGHREATQRIQKQRQELEGKASVLTKQIAELKAERDRLATGVEEGLLGRYERILRNKHGQAIVRIAHRMCTGCHLKLIAQEINDSMRDDQIVTCSNCGRILYWEPD